MDILAYLLCYGLEVKDKPRKAQFGIGWSPLITSPFVVPDSMVYADLYPTSFRPSLPKKLSPPS